MAAFMKTFLNALATKNARFLPLCKAAPVQRIFSTYSLNLRHCYPAQRLPCLQSLAKSSRPRFKSSAVVEHEHELPKDVVQKVESEMQTNQTRLFAVVFIAGQQFKVTTNDLIQIQQHIPADMGERIRLNKVLLVGGDNFTLLGRPLLSPEQVRVEATVVEKTKSQKIVVFKMKQRTRFRKYHEKYAKLSVLRINSIEIAPKVS